MNHKTRPTASWIVPVLACGSLLALTLTAASEPKPKQPAAPATTLSSEDVAFFESKVRPVLAENCYSCHAASRKSAKGGLQLDSRAGWMKGGSHGPAILPGKPDSSLLIKAVRYHDEDLQMPPAGKLSASQIAALEDWVKRGAPDPRSGTVTKDSIATPKKLVGMSVEDGHKFWSFQPLKAVALPPVKTQWGYTPLDYFVLSKMATQGLKPNPAADRRTLIRRAYFDLIGLPPTPAEIDAFLHDKSANAYEKVVDHLLDSPHYGERWGRHWLDLARYADSHGYEQDYDRPYAYQYRDFVIKALNQDMPYNQFVRWQLAGDELAPDEPMALMATGFLAAGVHSTQITKNQATKERYDELDDMSATTGVAMLGLTVGCARCHDHKYDPIPTRDYYRLLSTFTTTVRSDMDINVDPRGYQQAKATFDKAHIPLVEALQQYEREQLPQRFQEWLKGTGTQLEQPQWLTLDWTKFESKGGATLTPLPDGSLLASGTNPDNDTYTFVATTHRTGITAFRLEALADSSLVRGGPGRASNGNFALTDFKVTAAPLANLLDTKAEDAKPQEIKLIAARATFEQQGLPVAAAIDGDATSGWAVDPQFGKDQAAVFETYKPIGFAGGTVLTFTLKFDNNTGHSIGRPRLSLTTQTGPVPFNGATQPDGAAQLLAMLQSGQRSLTAEEWPTVLKWYRDLDPGWRKLNEQVQAHLATAPKPHIEKALICSEGVPAVRNHTQGDDFLPETHFLRRGDPNNAEGVATQGFLQVLMRTPDAERHWQEPPPAGWHTSYRRRALANWITDTDEGAGPLLARVIVNRLWQHHMGRGLVGTPSDFGTQGERPVNPELLEWLATELVHNGWRLKPLHRLIMLSAAYRQSAAFDAAKAKIDPENKYCWRHPRQRLEAEVIRDAMLAVSNTLDTTMFGPGTLDENQKRRSIYFMVKRSHLIPMMRLFDAPDALQSIAVRQVTTVAPQALMLMNNQNVHESAVSFAHRLLPTPATTNEDVINEAYMTALGRPPDATEKTDALSFLSQQTASYQAAGQSDARQLALVDFCQTLLCLNEF
ncbi:MAG: PSD1 domain-containing protein, partial [Abitibacteriaceae bacterium]|nr:PSD1 domain-containing protein [Abditibacteriaceae bacterium]